MTVDKVKLQEVIDDLKPYIEATLQQHGFATPRMQWTYGASLGLKLSADLLAEGPEGINLSSKEAQYYSKFGFHPLDAPLGTVFNVRGESFVFAGIAASRRKYPIYVKNLETGAYSFFTEQVASVINAAAKAAV